MSAFGGFSNLLLHTAVVFRRDEEGGTYKRDRFKQPTRDEQFSHLLECRITAAKGREKFTDRSHDVVETTHVLFMEKGADLSEQDVVTVLDAKVDAVAEALEDDPETFMDGFHSIVDRAEVLLAVRNNDGVGEHHRQAKLTTQRQTGPAR